MSTIKNFVFIRLCRITIHVLQLNIEKAEILPLCYNLVTTTKQKGFEEHTTCSSALFVNHLVKAFPCPIECTQTDNGTEFTNLFSTHRDKTALFQVRFGSMVPYNIPQKSGKTAPFYRSSFSRFTYYIFYISTFTLSRCQISLTYSSIVRSEVNFPLFATFRIAERAHAVSLRYASSTFFCTSA